MSSIGRWWGASIELGLLRQMFERTVAERRSGLATVLGFPGIGKSRLALGLAESLAGEARVLVGHCRSYGEGITYWPIAEMVREAFGLSVNLGLVQLLDRQPDGERIAALVGAALGEAEVTGAGEETFWAVGGCSRPWLPSGRWCWCSRTSTGLSRRCLT